MKQCPICGVRFDERSARCPIDAAELVNVPDPLIGRVVQDRYVIEALLGSGGMATVYRGRHRLIDRQVALKFLKPRQALDATARARFLREARAVNRVQHEHIVGVSDYGETDDGLVYMVMEYLVGRTLGTDIAQGPMALERVCHIGLQLARALASAHEHGIVHRDVKPANIFLIQRERESDTDFVKLLDFGLARGTEDVALTSSNLLFGTPEYMAPEQVRGTAVGAKADLYALGCVLFEMVTGRIPFDGARTGLVYRHLYDLPPRPSELRPEVPAELDRLILQLLSKTPEQRPADADAVADALGEVTARVAPSASRLLRRPNSHTPSLDQLKARVAERYSREQPPLQLSRALQHVSDLVQESHELQQGLSRIEVAIGASASPTTQLRIGAAIESLELDAAGAAQAMEALSEAKQQASARLNCATTQLLEAWRPFEANPASRPEAAPAHGLLMERLRAWAVAQHTAAALDSQIGAQQAVRADLQQQIAQLKRRLLAVDAELQPTIARAAELQLQLSAKLAAIRTEAERITEQLARPGASAAGERD